MTMMLIIFVFQLGFIQYLAKVSKIGLGLTIYMEIYEAKTKFVQFYQAWWSMLGVTAVILQYNKLL